MTLITIRLRREFSLCQVTIICYTRWPFLFLNRFLAPVQTAQNHRRVARAPRGINPEAFLGVWGKPKAELHEGMREERGQ